jgi:hypothetical protein
MIRWMSSTIGCSNLHAITMNVHDVLAVKSVHDVVAVISESLSKEFSLHPLRSLR